LGAGLLLVLLGPFWKEYETDLARAEAVMVEGRGTREVSSTDNGPLTYSYTIGGAGGTDFEVNEKAYKGFVEGRYYRAYYLPYSGMLANIEVLDLQELPGLGALPARPVCGTSEAVSHVPAADLAQSERPGCGAFLSPFNLAVQLLRGRNPMREQQVERARRARLAMLARRTPLYQCKRDQVVFVPGTGKAVSMSEIAGMLGRKEPGVNCPVAERGAGRLNREFSQRSEKATVRENTCWPELGDHPLTDGALSAYPTASLSERSRPS
jgi:hypothetical protein